MIDSIAAYGNMEGIGNVATNATRSTTFIDWMSTELTKANGAINDADVNLKKLAANEPVALHEVMLSIEEARLQFQLVTQVRNRILDAYQDLLKMQI
ncbi:MAG: flagellar hook-basal body complex protein FliE [Pseudomonadota bacterium]